MPDSNWKMVARSAEDFDLVAGGLIVELSRGEETGKWTFWGVRCEGTEDRIGAINSALPPGATAILEHKYAALVAAVEGDDTK